ncbi:MAG TPA: type II secretion system protein GspG [bacterium]|nr:type II secretion system protein GspG [bacterium]
MSNVTRSASRASLAAASILALAATAGCHDDSAKISRARQEIGIQAGVLMNSTTVPKDQADFDKLTAVAGCPEDPWGAPYAYERLAMRKIRISSKGKDGKLGTPDDVSEEFTFPTGSGAEEVTITRADGTKALKSPDGAHTFWTVQKIDGDDQTIEYWIGDAKADAAKPFKTEKLNGDWRRSVTLAKWTKDGRFVQLHEVVMPSRPDGSDNKETDVVVDVAGAKLAEASAVPADASWIDY